MKLHNYHIWVSQWFWIQNFLCQPYLYTNTPCLYDHTAYENNIHECHMMAAPCLIYLATEFFSFQFRIFVAPFLCKKKHVMLYDMQVIYTTSNQNETFI